MRQGGTVTSPTLCPGRGGSCQRQREAEESAQPSACPVASSLCRLWPGTSALSLSFLCLLEGGAPPPATLTSSLSLSLPMFDVCPIFPSAANMLMFQSSSEKSLLLSPASAADRHPVSSLPSAAPVPGAAERAAFASDTSPYSSGQGHRGEGSALLRHQCLLPPLRCSTPHPRLRPSSSSSQRRWGCPGPARGPLPSSIHTLAPGGRGPSPGPRGTPGSTPEAQPSFPDSRLLCQVLGVPSGLPGRHSVSTCPELT